MKSDNAASRASDSDNGGALEDVEAREEALVDDLD